MKLKIISTLSIVLIIIAIYFAFFKDRNSVYNKYDFAIKDTSNIDLIILEKNKDKIQLSKHNKIWKLNNTYFVNNNTLKNFLRIYSNLEFVSTVDNRLKDSILTILDKEGIKVIIKNNDKIISELIIGNINKYNTGTYVKKTNTDAVLINALGLTNDISKSISINSLFWRNKTIFNFNVNEIKKIEFYNKTNENKSFKIERTNDSYILKDYENKEQRTSFKNIERYLSYFRKINFAQIESNLKNTEKDSIINKNFAYKIIIEDNNSVKYELKLYFKPNPQKTEYIHDLNNIYGLFNNDSNLLIIQYFTIDPIIKEISYFTDNQ